jgi:F-type H+/Na+-transporting ATPase subunit alpha
MIKSERSLKKRQAVNKMDDIYNRDTKEIITDVFNKAAKSVSSSEPVLEMNETGIVWQSGRGIARVKGLPGAGAEELLLFKGGGRGMVFNLEPDDLSVILLNAADSIISGTEVKRTGMVISVPVGEGLLGRVIDPLGMPLDKGPGIIADKYMPIERDAPSIMDRAPVSIPLQTGILSVDALIPVGRGQRELIIGDRQTGKSALVLDTIINQKDKNVICVYCSIGQQSSGTARFIDSLKKSGAKDHTIVVVASGNDTPGMNYIAPYAATSIAEYFMEKGNDVLIIYDDLSKHARSYRELSLLMRRPPAREAFPGDIFYIHSRLLERCTHYISEKGGGSLTALPVVETESQNIAAYIPTNLVSITDGQIYLSPKIQQDGIMPPIDIGKSVSRVGGQAQLAAYRDIAGDLRLLYTQFEELELFERFSTRLDKATKDSLERGHRIREVFKQRQFSPLPVFGQIAILLSLTSGGFDIVPVNKTGEAARIIAALAMEGMETYRKKAENSEKLTDDDKSAMLLLLNSAIAHLKVSE